MNEATILDHPILKHKLSCLRNQATPSWEFRSLIKEITSFLCYEACKTLATASVEIETPMGNCRGQRLAEIPVIVSIMRAGIGMADAISAVIPQAHTGHIGIYRDKFIHNTVEYYFKIPTSSQGRRILLVDPLIATGDTAVACIDRLKEAEVGQITFLTILASREGLAAVHSKHPDVQVITVGIEDQLNDQGYLLPGLGDVGDRFYNTK